MFAALKAEFRKLLTVRSTYFIVGATLLITMFFAGFIEGFRNDAGSLRNPGLLADQSSSAIVFVGLILAFAGLLLAGHEYRYNTIMYTLTASNKRYKVFLAKFLTITMFTLLMSALITFFSPFCTIVGAHLAGNHVGPQTFDVWSLLWRCMFCGWGYAVYAFILLIALRNQVGAIVTFLLVPLIGENILMALLKDNSKYLPFTALQSVASPDNLGNHANSGHEALVVLVYVVVGLLVSSILFIRRDAN
jgi:ABC-type transport system involved in multi-copper enzyme maturation permease subunit